MNDFYVGYLPKAPASLGRFVRKVVTGLALIAAVVALLSVRSQRSFAKSVFEFGTVRSFEGVFGNQPYPMLLVARPGTRGQQQLYSQYLLVAPGKFRADELIGGFAGKPARLKGQLIYPARSTLG